MLVSLLCFDKPNHVDLRMKLRPTHLEWIEKTGVNFRLELPHVAFHRHVGEFKDVHASPSGVILSDAEWAKLRRQDGAAAAGGYERIGQRSRRPASDRSCVST